MISSNFVKGTIRNERSREIMQTNNTRNLPLNSLIRNKNIKLKISGNSKKKQSEIFIFL